MKKNVTPNESTLLSLADYCVKCGLCSTTCPTYQLTQDENESPRGRIALAQALASNSIKDLSKLSTHIDNCLSCRKCESVCPSGVKYGELIDLTRITLQEKQPPNALSQFIIKRISTLNHKQWLTIEKFWRFCLRFRLNKFANILPLGKKLNLTISRNYESLATNDISNQSKSVSLFTGCLSHLFDKTTTNASIQLLNELGFQVNIPNDQSCCGAIALHNGFAEVANQCVKTNINAFPQDQDIIFLATGCGATLKELYQENSSDFANRSVDINSFLLRSEEFNNRKFNALQKTVFLHAPCSEKHVLKQIGEVKKLLSKIPDLEIKTSSVPISCCGAAGSHIVSHAHQAQLIRKPLIDEILASNADYLISANYTCNMHLLAGLREKKIDIPSLHPIKLLLAQMVKE